MHAYTCIYTCIVHISMISMKYNSAFAHRYIDGGTDHGWVSLSGIIFTTDATVQSALPLASGWTGWTTGAVWPGPTYAVAEGGGVHLGRLWSQLVRDGEI